MYVNDYTVQVSTYNGNHFYLGIFYFLINLPLVSGQRCWQPWQCTMNKGREKPGGGGGRGGGGDGGSDVKCDNIRSPRGVWGPENVGILDSLRALLKCSEGHVWADLDHLLVIIKEKLHRPGQ